MCRTLKGIIFSVLWYGLVNSSCPRNALIRLPFVVEYAVWRGWRQAVIYAPDQEPVEYAVWRGWRQAVIYAPDQEPVEYAVWRGWRQAVIYAPDQEPGCLVYILRLEKCLGVNGIASSVGRDSSPRVLSRLGVIVLVPMLHNTAFESLTKMLKQLHDFKMNTGAYDWLVMARTQNDFKKINGIFNVTDIRFDQNIVVVYPHWRNVDNLDIPICKSNFAYKQTKQISNKNIISEKTRSNCRFGVDCIKSEYENNYYRSSERFSNLTRKRTYRKNDFVVPLEKSGILLFNFSKQFEMVNISGISRNQVLNESLMNRGLNKSVVMHVIQYFKVRINATLYAHDLGVWDLDSSMSTVDVPYPVEARNFLGETFRVGRLNLSKEVSEGEEEIPSSPILLDDVLYFLNVRLNASGTCKQYTKLGFRTYEGSWSGLLGAVMENTVDIALEPVTTNGLRHREVEIIFPIAVAMSNIYLRQQETSTVRDIFMAPFSGHLVACVVAVAVVAAVAVVVISKVAPCATGVRSMGYAEGLVWATGILCQQGGGWTPSSPAASVVLVVTLLFAVVTYNAYAAFITSVLSVRVASVDTVSAVLSLPDYKIGYIRNGPDQMYLMSTKDAQLNAIYIRGYSDADLVSSTAEGLARAASQDYAFFASQRQARTALRSLSQARGRCAVREVPVPSTRAFLAFPLPPHSPYAKPILVSLLLLRSGGSLARLSAALVPDLPQCAPPPGFASARATDVRSALILLAIGLIVSFSLGLVEYCWKNRKEVIKIFSFFYRRFVRIIK